MIIKHEDIFITQWYKDLTQKYEKNIENIYISFMLYHPAMELHCYNHIWNTDGEYRIFLRIKLFRKYVICQNFWKDVLK